MELMPTDSDWIQADRAYQTHHFACPQCIAAGLRPGLEERCPLGLQLWHLYLRASASPLSQGRSSARVQGAMEATSFEAT